MSENHPENLLTDIYSGYNGLSGSREFGNRKVADTADDSYLYSAMVDVSVDVSYAGSTGLCNVLNNARWRKTAIGINEYVVMRYGGACNGALHIEMHKLSYHHHRFLLRQERVNVNFAHKIVGWS